MAIWTFTDFQTPVKNGLTVYCGSSNFIPAGDNWLDQESKYIVNPGHSPSPDNSDICKGLKAMALMRSGAHIISCQGVDCDPEANFAMIVLCKSVFEASPTLKIPVTYAKMNEFFKERPDVLVGQSMDRNLRTVCSKVLLHELFHVLDAWKCRLHQLRCTGGQG
jgi:hypothetical protein